MTTNGIALNAAEATVRTCTVEVRVMKLGKKQMTLSVFRQLEYESIFHPDPFDLKAEPWGRVNYFWGGCEGTDGHLHLVWQKGDELRRCCVDRNAADYGPANRSISQLIETMDQVRRLVVLHNVLAQKPQVSDAGSKYLDGRWQSLKAFSCGGWSYKFEEAPARAIKSYWEVKEWLSRPGNSPEQTTNGTRREEEARSEIYGLLTEGAERLEESGLGFDLEEPTGAVRAHRRLAQELQGIYSRWEANYRLLAAAPQLFIAV